MLALRLERRLSGSQFVLNYICFASLALALLDPVLDQGAYRMCVTNWGRQRF